VIFTFIFALIYMQCLARYVKEDKAGNEKGGRRRSGGKGIFDPP
jgi:hypothetical protein